MFAAKSIKADTSSSSATNHANMPFFQPKLETGKPGDPYEVEADRAAEQILTKGNDRLNATTFFPSATAVQKKPLLESITPFIQNKEPKEERQAQLSKGSPEEKEAEPEKIQKQAETDIQKQGKTEHQIQNKSENNFTTPEIQKKEEEDLPEKSFLQKSEGPPSEAEDELPPVQAKPVGSILNTSSIESQLNSSKGGGSPMPENTRTEMESGFGTDFGNVRIHTGSSAEQMNKGLGAQAFTHGNDIYFNEGKFNPASNPGKHLLAHELTHTVQQGASVRPKMIQKTEGEETPAVPETGDKYDLSQNPPKIYIDNLPIPAFKNRFMSADNNFRAREFSEGGREGESDPEQSDVWNSSISEAGSATEITTGGIAK